MIMLVLPYFLVATCEALAQKPGTFLRILIGILASIGFALKPYFLVPLVFIELYLMFEKKSFLSWVRIESMLILILLICYLISIAVFTPTYFTQMLPIILHLYLNGMTASTIALLNNPYILVFSIMLILGLISLGSKKHSQATHKLILILLLGAIGFFICYYIQFRNWFYHLIPMLTLTSLILAICFIENILFLIKNKLPFSQIKPQIISFISLTALFLMIEPGILFTLATLNMEANPHSAINKLIVFTKQQAEHKPIFFFSTMQDPDALITQYSHATLGSRFMSQWLIPGIVNNSHAKLTPLQRHYNKYAAILVKNLVVEDFQRYKPTLVFVDVAQNKQYIHWPFNYIAFFSQNKQFKSIWKHYHFVKKIGLFDIYEISPLD